MTTLGAQLDKKCQKVVIKSPGKVNLFLEITGKRSDGYHNVVTVMQAIDLYDMITIEFSRSLKVINKKGKDPLNLITRTINELELYTNQKFNVSVKVEKNIPIGAGLGSGASNVAAIINGLDRLYQLRLTNTDKKRLASSIGSDVTFFLQSKVAVCKGRGDLVEDIPIKEKLEYVIIVPNERLLTKDVYEALTREHLTGKKSPNPMINSIKKGSINDIRANMFNRLWIPAEKLCATLGRIKNVAEDVGLDGLQLTGSGSAFFYPYSKENVNGKLKDFQDQLKKLKIKHNIYRCKGLS